MKDSSSSTVSVSDENHGAPLDGSSISSPTGFRNCSRGVCWLPALVVLDYFIEELRNSEYFGQRKRMAWCFDESASSKRFEDCCVWNVTSLNPGNPAKRVV